MMKPKTYKVLEIAIEEGVRLGINRAIKADYPAESDFYVEAVIDALMLVITEHFDFPEESQACSVSCSSCCGCTP